MTEFTHGLLSKSRRSARSAATLRVGFRAVSIHVHRLPGGAEEIEVAAEHELLAPTLLRSQTLSRLHEAVHAGEIAPKVALERLNRIRAMPIRLLGDAVPAYRQSSLGTRVPAP